MAMLTMLGLSAPAQAAGCYADYKAKRNKPFRLHYGVAQIHGGCSKGAAQSELSARLGANGWILLKVISVFGNEALSGKKNSAGQYFLRY